MAETVILDEDEMQATLARLAAEIQKAHPAPTNLLLAGIERRGADLAVRLADLMGLRKNDIARLDINLYRDDWTRLSDGVPHIGSSSMPALPDDRPVLLVDDVLFSGRTVRAAMEAIMDFGRPGKIELLVLVDRGHRELPICADFVGRHLETEKEQHVDVLLRERDGRDAVILRQG